MDKFFDCWIDKVIELSNIWIDIAYFYRDVMGKEFDENDDKQLEQLIEETDNAIESYGDGLYIFDGTDYSDGILVYDIAHDKLGLLGGVYGYKMSEILEYLDISSECTEDEIQMLLNDFLLKLRDYNNNFYNRAIDCLKSGLKKLLETEEE